MTRSRLFLMTCLIAVGVAGGFWLKSLHAEREPAAAASARGEAAVSVVTALARTEDFPVRKRAIGFVETPASVALKSRIDSQITQQHVRDGQFVKAGDLLFALDDRDIAAQIAKDEAMIARDEATHTRTQLDLARYQQLLARNAGTQQSVDQAVADERTAAATIQADKATLEADRLKLSYTRILSPIDGRVGAVAVTVGNLVSAGGSGSALVTITQMKPLRVSFTMPERDLPVLQAALASGRQLPVQASIPDAKRPPVQGVLDFVDSSVDMASGTIVAKATFANDDLALWPGQYVDVELLSDTLKAVTVIPAVAVQTGQSGPYVYVGRADGTVELRPVRLALSEGADTALEAGVAAGERVVTDGQMRLKTGTKIRERDAASAAPGGTPVAEGERS